MLQELFSTPHVRLKVDEAAHLLETEWLGFCNSTELRGALNEALELGARFRVRGWVGNNLQMRTIRPQDQDWINTDWFPRFAQLGVERMALVVSNDALNRMGVDHIMSRATAHTPFAMQYFDNAESARAWAGFANGATPDPVDPSSAS